MKKRLLFIIVLFLKAFFGFSQSVPLNDEYDFIYPEKIEEPSELQPNQKIFKDSLKNGTWIAYSKYESDYCVFEVKNGSIDGTFFYKYPSGRSKWKIEYKLGKKIGIWQRFSEDNLLQDEIPYENDLANGQIKKYENGKLSGLMDYRNGVENGKFVGYHENGNLSFDGTFINGKREGQFFNYHDDGFLYLVEFYKNGEMIKNKIIKRKKVKSKT